MSVLPPLPTPPPANLLLFSSQQWNWLTSAITAIYAAHEAELESLGGIISGLEMLMAQDAELTSEVATLRANLTEVADRISSEIADLAAAIAAQGQPSAEVAAAIDSLKQANTQLAALGTSLAADDPAP